MWRSKGALWLSEWTPVKSADVWKDFIYNKWWTEVVDTADAGGECAIPAFFGEHRIEVEGMTSKEVAMSKAEGEIAVEIVSTEVPDRNVTGRSIISVRQTADRLIIYGVSADPTQLRSTRMYSPTGKSVALPIRSGKADEQSGICIDDGLDRLSHGMYFVKIPGAGPIPILMN